MLRNRRKFINELINSNAITIKQQEDHFKKLYDDITVDKQQTYGSIEEKDRVRKLAHRKEKDENHDNKTTKSKNHGTGRNQE